MAEERTTKKATAAIAVNRVEGPSPLCIYARRFHIREDDAKVGMIALTFESPGNSEPPPRLLFDLGFFDANKAGFEQFLAKLGADVDELAQTQESVFTAEVIYANICFAAYFGNRSETSFCVMSLNDWADAKRKLKPGSESSVRAMPVLSVYSSLGFQKKLLSELLRLRARK